MACSAEPEGSFPFGGPAGFVLCALQRIDDVLRDLTEVESEHRERFAAWRQLTARCLNYSFVPWDGGATVLRRLNGMKYLDDLHGLVVGAASTAACLVISA